MQTVWSPDTELPFCVPCQHLFPYFYSLINFIALVYYIACVKPFEYINNNLNNITTILFF